MTGLEGFPAHIRIDGEQKIEQSVMTHCRNAASYASDFLQTVGLGQTGYLLGLVHDYGKLTMRFLDYIRRAANGEPVHRGSVNHTFSAVKLLLNRYHLDCDDPYRKITAELLALSVGAHHGLFDCVGPDRKNGFAHRLDKEDELYAEASEHFFNACAPHELDRLFSLTCVELRPVLERIISMGRSDGAELSYYLGCLSRLMLSALIDGDRRDAAEFMEGKKPQIPSDLSVADWQRCLSRMETTLNNLPHDTEIQRARAILSQRCRDRAAVSGGIYRLNLPTGAGKTLSSLRFALAHAAAKGKKRIIFAVPLLSILEQNAAVIRDAVQDDGLILEHHSNVVHAGIRDGELSPMELFTESWNAPIIITTLVQLLNTLFSGEPAAIRRFHSLCGSIIIIDEIQSLPAKLLSMFQLAMSFLSELCGATVLLCSATQPAQDCTAHPYLTEPEDLVPYDAALWNVFRRTELREAGRCTLDEISGKAKFLLENSDSLLIVCNKKDEASYLLHAMRDSGFRCFHLSASMCAAHRRKTVDTLKQALLNHNQKTVCISTQVIEAGVDISFACVIRLTAGMDNVVQAAGRCNRNGESETPAPVYILDCIDENLSRLCEIKAAKDATTALLAEYRRNQEKFAFDLSSDTAIRFYYQRLYGEMPQGAMDYPAGEHGTLFDLLSSNTKYAVEGSACYGQYFLCQAFKTAGALFSVFDTQSESLLVPYGDGAEIIRRLQALGDRLDPEAISEIRILLEESKPYSVSVFPYQLDWLEQQGAVARLCRDSVLVLQPDCFGDILYSEDTGLITRKE